MAKLHNTYAFIDSQNLNMCVKSMGWKIDYRRFRQYLVRVDLLRTALEYKPTKKTKISGRSKP